MSAANSEHAGWIAMRAIEACHWSALPEMSQNAARTLASILGAAMSEQAMFTKHLARRSGS